MRCCLLGGHVRQKKHAEPTRVHVLLGARGGTLAQPLTSALKRVLSRRAEAGMCIDGWQVQDDDVEALNGKLLAMAEVLGHSRDKLSAHNTNSSGGGMCR